MKRKTKSSGTGEMMMMGCCFSYGGLIHAAVGAGLALLVVEYFDLGSLALWGWLLVGLGVVGHFFKMSQMN
jgi:hypothetical protein